MEFDELDELRSLVRRASGVLRAETHGHVVARGQQLPLYSFELGSQDPDVPAVGFFGGVHGVERIGTQVVLTILQSLLARLRWDEVLAHTLTRVRLVFMPLVNPGGMLQRTRCNPAGVDLTRNAPVDASGRVAFLVGGQRLTSLLPWYRGRDGAPMEPEAQALCRVVETRILGAPFCLTLDCHSGFGVRNHVWFPYAHTPRAIDYLADIYALRTLFRTTHPHHSIYVIEPQSRRYTTHGDLWDYLYERSRSRARGLFLPLTLEMGSWLWVKKNPLQLLLSGDLFNPVEPHRERRILRQHLVLADFLIRAAISHAHWRPRNSQRQALHDAALDYWLRRRF